MTSLEWLEREQTKAMMIDAERIPLILDQPEHMVAIYLSMADGFRALISNCIYENNNQLL
jgi:hypothetical protein